MADSSVRSPLAVALTAPSRVTTAEIPIIVGRQNMYPARNIVENLVNSQDHTLLVAVIMAADFVDTLQGAGPFTLFAPTDAAFGRLTAGIVETLVKPGNRATLAGILTGHLMAGNLTFRELARLIKEGHGQAELAALNGARLPFMMNGQHNIVLKDAKGNIANISTYDVNQSNGVIHVIDSIVMP
ncbi:MAG: fasciclin domain-containing protein [Verrucomicrobiae bacterium]|nr:fasciclin domain-containing protein [Verrucomicrobiae bacterium]